MTNIIICLLQISEFYRWAETFEPKPKRRGGGVQLRHQVRISKDQSTLLQGIVLQINVLLLLIFSRFICWYSILWMGTMYKNYQNWMTS